MLYFNSTACVNLTGNPSGDGIDNWDKFVLGLNPNIAYASPLLITPPGGDFVAMPSISVYSLSGSSIKYTTNGSIPSATNGLTTTSGAPLTNLPSGSFTLKAWESGLTSNAPISATYAIIPATPIISLPPGLYDSGATVQISCLNTNAVVRYTTNGIDPATTSTQIWPTNIISLTTNVTIKAAACLNGFISPVAQASYIVESLPTAPPPNDNFSNAITLTGASGIVSGTTLNGTLEPFETNQVYQSYDDQACQDGDSVWYKWVAPSNGTVYFDCFAFMLDLGAWVFPTNTGPNPTNLVPDTLELNSGDGIYYYTLTATQNTAYYISASIWHNLSGPFQFAWQYVGPTTEPFFRPDAGTSLTAELVTVFDSHTNAVIHYTMDGTAPTESSPVIASGTVLSISQTTTLKAAA
jgi:hypothetical protein